MQTFIESRPFHHWACVLLLALVQGCSANTSSTAFVPPPAPAATPKLSTTTFATLLQPNTPLPSAALKLAGPSLSKPVIGSKLVPIKPASKPKALTLATAMTVPLAVNSLANVFGAAHVLVSDTETRYFSRVAVAPDHPSISIMNGARIAVQVLPIANARGMSVTAGSTEAPLVQNLDGSWSAELQYSDISNPPSPHPALTLKYMLGTRRVEDVFPIHLLHQ